MTGPREWILDTRDTGSGTSSLISGISHHCPQSPRIRVSLPDTWCRTFPRVFSSAPSLVSNYIFHASELCHSMGGFMVYSLFGIIQIIVKYFETFYTLFVQFYPSFHSKTVISPASIGNRISSTCKKFRESLKLTKSFLSIHFITLLKGNCNKSFLDTFYDDKILSVFRLVIIRRKCQ